MTTAAIAHAQGVHDFLETAFLHFGHRANAEVPPERFEGTPDELLNGMRSSLIRALVVYGTYPGGWDQPIPSEALALLRAQATGESLDRSVAACVRVWRIAAGLELALEAARRKLRAAQRQALPAGLSAWPCADWPCGDVTP